MTFILKQDIIPNNWILLSVSGNIIAGPKYFEHKFKAIDWANNFISSFNGANLIVE